MTSQPTPEERAKALFEEIAEQINDRVAYIDPSEATSKTAAAIREAIEAEREACAKIAQQFKDSIISAHLPVSEGGQNLPQSCEANTFEGVARDIEIAIRARSGD